MANFNTFGETLTLRGVNRYTFVYIFHHFILTAVSGFLLAWNGLLELAMLVSMNNPRTKESMSLYDFNLTDIYGFFCLTKKMSVILE